LGRKLTELADLFAIFSLETRYSFEGKRVLYAGTGTGHRLIEAASALKNTQFMAVDLSEASLAIARQAAGEQDLQNVQFQLCNLMENDSKLGAFDVILCMVVLPAGSSDTPETASAKDVSSGSFSCGDFRKQENFDSKFG